MISGIESSLYPSKYDVLKLLVTEYNNLCEFVNTRRYYYLLILLYYLYVKQWINVSLKKMYSLKIVVVFIETILDVYSYLT